MKKLFALICAAAVICADTANAMPSQDEIVEVQPLVAKLMGPSVAAFKAKKISGSEVGDKALKLAEEAEGEAAKFLCMKGAVTYYVKDKEYDKAAETIEAIMAQFQDIPADMLQGITSSATKGVSAKSAPKLFDIHRMASVKAAGAKKLKGIKAQLRKTPADKDLIRRYAELTAAGGNWEDALQAFAKLGGDIGKMAKSEIEGSMSAAQLAEFWWDYEVQEAGAKDAIRQHSAGLYQSAIDNGELKGLKKTLAEECIAQLHQTPAPRPDTAKDYMIVDLSTGRVTYEKMSNQEASNKRYQADKYKTQYLVLRRVPANNNYYVGDDNNTGPVSWINRAPNTRHKVRIPKDYYMAIYELTEAQWDWIMGGPNRTSKMPKGAVSWNMVRGNAPPLEIPSAGMMGKLNKLTKLKGFDLPTESMFEIASRAGSEDIYIGGKSADSVSDYAWMGLGYGVLHEVGTKKPNAWGFYDTCGNVWEFVRDTFNPQNLAMLQPNGLVPVATGKDGNCVFRGMGCNIGAEHAGRFSFRHTNVKNLTNADCGIRVSYFPQ